MKIVINKCYGGFGLSAKAVKRLCELRGDECYFFLRGKDGGYKSISLEEVSKNLMWYAFKISNPNDFISNKTWHNMSKEERIKRNNELNKIYIDHYNIKRNDLLLIQIIEELSEEANGTFADLRIVEIPDDIEYEIDEYDGMEKIVEVHRMWE